MNKYPHYHKPVEGLKTVDVYRVLELFEVNDHAIGHAIKKLMCAGKRGGKDFETDIREAVDTLNRRLQMIAEDDSNERKFPTDADGFYAWNGGENPLKHRCTIVVKCRDGVRFVCMSNEPKWEYGEAETALDVVGWRHADASVQPQAKWEDHDGGKMPCAPEARVEIERRDGQIYVHRASEIRWDYQNTLMDRYQVVRWRYAS